MILFTTFAYMCLQCVHMCSGMFMCKKKKCIVLYRLNAHEILQWCKLGPLKYSTYIFFVSLLKINIADVNEPLKVNSRQIKDTK